MKEFFRFEIARRLRQPMVYVFTAVNFVLIYAALNSDNVSVGNPLPNVNANAPYLVQQQVLLMTVVGLLITTALVNTAAVRDFTDKFDGILFTKPIRKLGYLAGRFLGAVLMASVPLLGVLLAVWLTGFDLFGGARVGPTYWAAYGWAIVLIVLPNTIFAGSIIFSLALLTRSQVAGFVGALGMLVAYVVAGSLLSDLDVQRVAALLDPFGFGTFGYETRYWTAVEFNSQYLTAANGTFLLNRLIWLCFSTGVAAFTYFRFSFAGSTQKVRKAKQTPAQAPAANPALDPATDWAGVRPVDASVVAARAPASARATLVYSVGVELKAVLRSRVFLVIVAFSVLNTLGSMVTVDESFGTGNYPVTYLMVQVIRGSLYLFLGAVVVYYAGELVWRERDANMAELFDATPVAAWVAPIAKFLALSLVPLIVLLGAVVIGMVVQTAKGYTDYELGQYATQLLLLDWAVFVSFGALALFLQAVVDDKYLGYFAFLALLLVMTFGFDAVGITNNLFIFGSLPSTTYTAFNHLAPYTAPVATYAVYWIAVSLLAVAAASLFWVRGRGHSWRNRARLAAGRFDGSIRLYSLGLGAVALLLGGWIYYNTALLNPYLDEDGREAIQVEYERRYRRFGESPMPTITEADYRVDLYPGERALRSVAKLTVQNQHREPIDTILLVTPEGYSMSAALPGARLVRADSTHGVLLYALDEPLLPTERRVLTATSRYAARGIENEVSNTSIVPNGTFVNQDALAPRLGYQPRRQLSDRDDREKYGLPAERRTPKLPAGDCGAPCGKTYLANDAHWVRLSATVSTDADQIAVAPGSLVSETTDEATGRRTFRYEVETPVLHFFSVVSGRFEVRRERWGEVDLEVYHLPEHAYNVDKMVEAMRASLSYYSEDFGPYPHRQARIIEFPRYRSFAQAFPGTMPYSESIGFIADLKDSTDVDYVYFVVAHEMAHQWWAHRVIGADVQGGTMLSESFAQYSALMVGKHAYGEDLMGKAIKYEYDRYLRGWGDEREAELPLSRVENQQYVHYRKGSVVLYALQDYVGEDSLNAALRGFYEEYAGQGPPYPTTRDFERHLRPRVPDSLTYLIDEWINDIVLYDNSVVAASTAGDTISFTVSVNKVRADSLGAETPLPIAGDFVDIGVYAAAEAGETLGKELWRERIRFTESGEREFELNVVGKPVAVVVDPDRLLIDRIDADNQLEVETL